MRIGLLGNPSSIGYLMRKELLKRGYECDLYSSHTDITDNSGFDLGRGDRNGLRLLLRRASIKYRGMIEDKYDILVNLGKHPNFGLTGKTYIDYWQGIEAKESVHKEADHNFATTLDLLSSLPSDTVLLPRPANQELFTPGHAWPITKTVVGHLWRRGGLVSDYASRYFKNTDLLFEAVEGQGILIDDARRQRMQMPKFFSKISLLAEQFRYGSYGLPAIESLLSDCPVVGYYEKGLVECPEAFEAIHVCQRTKESVLEKIREADGSEVGAVKEVRDYHSSKHTVDVFEDALKKWHLS